MKQHILISVLAPILTFPAIINNINSNFALNEVKDKNISGYVQPIMPFAKKEKDNKKTLLLKQAYTIIPTEWTKVE